MTTDPSSAPPMMNDSCVRRLTMPYKAMIGVPMAVLDLAFTWASSPPLDRYDRGAHRSSPLPIQ